MPPDTNWLPSQLCQPRAGTRNSQVQAGPAGSALSCRRPEHDLSGGPKPQIHDHCESWHGTATVRRLPPGRPCSARQVEAGLSPAGATGPRRSPRAGTGPGPGALAVPSTAATDSEAHRVTGKAGAAGAGGPLAREATVGALLQVTLRGFRLRVLTRSGRFRVRLILRP